MVSDGFLARDFTRPRARPSRRPRRRGPSANRPGRRPRCSSLLAHIGRSKARGMVRGGLDIGSARIGQNRPQGGAWGQGWRTTPPRQGRSVNEVAVDAHISLRCWSRSHEPQAMPPSMPARPVRRALPGQRPPFALLPRASAPWDRRRQRSRAGVGLGAQRGAQPSGAIVFASGCLGEEQERPPLGVARRARRLPIMLASSPGVLTERARACRGRCAERHHLARRNGRPLCCVPPEDRH